MSIEPCRQMRLPKRCLDDLRIHAVGRHLQRIEDVHAQTDDALDERHDGPARVEHDLDAVAVRHVHQLRQPRREAAVEQPRADQQPVLRAQVVGDAEDVDPARRGREHAVEVGDVEIGEAIHDVVGQLRRLQQIHQQPFEAAQEGGVLPDAGARRHDREIATISSSRAAKSVKSNQSGWGQGWAANCSMLVAPDRTKST